MESVYELIDAQETSGFFDVLAEYRRRPVPEGKRFFAMKVRPRARSNNKQARTHKCCIMARNRFGVWSQVLQRYVRKTRYLRFTRVGCEVAQLDRICSPLIKQYGMHAWAEYQPWREEILAMDAVVKKIYFDYAPPWIQRQIRLRARPSWRRALAMC
ncbi:hypothetical protein QOZ80_2BG0202760 [Eleusine coracana subsp. coracana]|nr:hypothetical protein QOZ80_2BG0202760 [Eleusine coracana subsp. coracana]